MFGTLEASILHHCRIDIAVDDSRDRSGPSDTCNDSTCPTSPSDLHLKRRLLVSGTIFFVGFAIAAARMVELQVIQRQYWQERAGRQQNISIRMPRFRRTVVDRHSVFSPHSEILAIDRLTYQLWSRPSLYVDNETYSSKQILMEALSPLLETSPAELRKLLDRPQSTLLGEKLSESEAQRIKAAVGHVNGVELTPIIERKYPQGSDAAEVVGYVRLDLERRGQAGVELAWQDILELQPAESLTVTTDASRNVLADAAQTPMMITDEQALQLTLDMRLQRTAREALRDTYEKFGAKRGAVIVLNPHTGEILAMASEPTYNPNYFYRTKEEDFHFFRNWAVSDLYEPGSTFKPITVALALEAGAILARDFVDDAGRLIVGGWPIHNYDYAVRGAPGPISISEVLQRSSNVGTIRIVERLGRRGFYAGLRDMGLGGRSNIDLPFEPNSTLKNRWQFLSYRVEAATTGFGQGVSVTPLQLAQLHAAIANGGYVVTPHVVQGLVDLDSDRLERFTQPGRERVLSPETTRAVREMMLDVVELGTGQTVAIPGYDIAGKTGTAQKANPNGGGYLPPSERITSFVGYFPALEPQYVILAVVDNPKGDNAFGSTVAAPIVKTIIEDIVAREVLQPKVHAAVDPDE